jgi:hypothetical protein
MAVARCGVVGDASGTVDRGAVELFPAASRCKNLSSTKETAMALVSSESGGAHVNVRPLVQGLFVATSLLSIVSWYTTERGMALYLSTWFSLLASTGLQAALVLVAWLIGFTRTKHALLIAVYAITATVSIAFSYVSLYTWFSVRERPAMVERQLYDRLIDAGGKAETMLAAAYSEGQKHILALDELTVAEKTLGHVSRAADADPYLAQVREAVAREAQTYADTYKEGAGQGVRYTAFERYATMARQSLDRIQASQRALADVRTQLKPLDSSEQQLRAFRQVFDNVPWDDAERVLHAGHWERPSVPAYSEFVDHTVSGQEDLLLAFNELLTAPTSRHALALALAAFIDIVVFLLAFASGPYFVRGSEQHWIEAAAAVDGADPQVFVRGFLAKLTAGMRGLARVDAGALTPGEAQLCLVLRARQMASLIGEPADGEAGGGRFYLIDAGFHERLLELLLRPGMPLRTMPSPRASTTSAG